MKRVKEYGMWSLMCPHECPGLADCWGEEFETLYTKYESEGKFKKQVKAQEVWAAIIESQIETGTPYMLYKDACNRKSNQQNLGTIKCSNLCTEIVEYSAPDEVGNTIFLGRHTWKSSSCSKFWGDSEIVQHQHENSSFKEGL